MVKGMRITKMLISLILVLVASDMQAGLIKLGNNKAELKQLDSLIQNDPNVIKTKPIGRFNRGIVNYKFIPKGHKIFGVTASYSNYQSDNSKALILLSDLNYKFVSGRVNPFVGYFIKDNVMIGVKFGYNNMLTNLENSSLDFDGLDFSIANVELKERMYTSSLLHRSYVGLDRGRRFGLFNETALSFTNGNSSFSRLQDGQPMITETSIVQMELGINPGVSVFIMQNVSAEMSFGIVGFNYRKEKQTVNNEDAGTFTSSGANFKISLLNINIGITVCL